ncbi:EF-P beta-lysylation protein EpmB [Psychrobacter sp. I-STPA6b]|uniref:EF-P beta-lysylation protein EpmB n=1 Tax=Psychrobacter sp. I-STPA6b TaxID=2585718 RepID=UPI001D0C29D5|nr:EF-P beta-lysylation protein EpmB [Psychrobacter sp. I-STPA6b]
MINHLPAQKNLSNTRLPVINQTGQSWQRQLADSIDDIDELLDILQLSALKASLYLPKQFGLRVPRGFVNKMRIGDAHDPLLQQVLPRMQEQVTVTGYVTDPLAENSANPIQGLLHKYRSRILVTVTGACAIHCRYCFRQHFDYQSNIPSKQQMAEIHDYILAHPEVNEIILSGGDPLSVSNRRLIEQLKVFESLPQITTIRLHTRLPIVIPERLDEVLLAYLSHSRCKIVMVLHTNHANEVDTHTANYLSEAKQAGIILLNQAVLLKGINDTLQAQTELSHKLFSVGILPYYLHILDKVSGAAHFDIPKYQAVKLYWQMLEELPGYLVPKLVQELPDQPFKTPVDLYQSR